MSAVALPIGAVMFSFSEESVLNGPPGQWVNPGALLRSSHAEPSTRPVCRVFFCSLSNLTYGPWSAALQPISIQAANVPTLHVWSQ